MWYILLDDITMKKSKYKPDESRLYLNGQETFQTFNSKSLVYFLSYYEGNNFRTIIMLSH